VLYAICAVIGNNFSSDGKLVPVADGYSWATVSWDWFRAVPLMTVAFAAHYNGPKLFQELQADLGKWNRVVLIEGLVVFFGYVAASWSGYAQYGSDTDGNVLNNYSDDNQSILVARLTIALATTFTFPFAFHSTLRTTKSLINREFNRMKIVALTIALLGLILLISIIFPAIAVVIEFKGALFGTFVIYVFPGMFYLAKLRQKQDSLLLGDSSLLREGSIQGEDEVAPSRLLPYVGVPWKVGCSPIVLILFGIITGIMGFIIVTIDVANGD